MSDRTPYNENGSIFGSKKSLSNTSTKRKKKNSSVTSKPGIPLIIASLISLALYVLYTWKGKKINDECVSSCIPVPPGTGYELIGALFFIIMLVFSITWGIRMIKYDLSLTNHVRYSTVASVFQAILITVVGLAIFINEIILGG